MQKAVSKNHAFIHFYALFPLPLIPFLFLAEEYRKETCSAAAYR